MIHPGVSSPYLGTGDHISNSYSLLALALDTNWYEGNHSFSALTLQQLPNNPLFSAIPYIPLLLYLFPYYKHLPTSLLGNWLTMPTAMSKLFSACKRYSSEPFQKLEEQFSIWHVHPWAWLITLFPVGGCFLASWMIALSLDPKACQWRWSTQLCSPMDSYSYDLANKPYYYCKKWTGFRTFVFECFDLFYTSLVISLSDELKVALLSPLGQRSKCLSALLVTVCSPISPVISISSPPHCLLSALF